MMIPNWIDDMTFSGKIIRELCIVKGVERSGRGIF